MSNDDAPTIRPTTPHDDAEILGLLEAAFGRWPSVNIDVPAIEHLHWKMNPPAALARPVHEVVVVDGQLAAFHLRWMPDIQIGGSTYRVLWSADLAVLPAFRGRGLSRLLNTADRNQRRDEGLFEFGTPSNAPQVSHMDGGDVVGRDLRVWVRTFGLRSFLARQLRGLPPRHLFPRRRPRPDPDAVPREVVELERFDERADELWESTRHEFDLVSPRSADFLNWRYRDPAGGPTIALGVVERDRLLGYAVFKRDGTWCNVIDLLTRPEQPAVARRLLAAGAARLRADGCRGMTCWLPPGHRDEHALQEAGFADSGAQRITFGLREHLPHPETLPVIEDPASRAHVTMGDFDFV